jgi:hypothetical protein
MFKNAIFLLMCHRHNHVDISFKQLRKEKLSLCNQKGFNWFLQTMQETDDTLIDACLFIAALCGMPCKMPILYKLTASTTRFLRPDDGDSVFL